MELIICDECWRGGVCVYNNNIIMEEGVMRQLLEECMVKDNTVRSKAEE